MIRSLNLMLGNLHALRAGRQKVAWPALTLEHRERA
ncbi:hypothetical protein DSM3645_29571 [Blastopirellula marina DSM 3645]|uniref:Uncharacterized protein n=1 Tax=Blastopirellula marina DSM 3645 TaxID=314230 RepID=A3ZXE4_9BACT|nr:hypothetical protein DSM3645_29571 [Blastopirellula marina DSM 3645]